MKPPEVERKLILARDHRRKYGSCLTFEVRRAEHIGDLENVTLFLPEGPFATIKPGRSLSWEGGKRYEILVEGFPTATDAELAGMRVAQGLLLCAVSLDFGLRLNYSSHEPASVVDRTLGAGFSSTGEGFQCWPQPVVLAELLAGLAAPLANRRLMLSMELFAAAELESNDRARFVMTVSALEPLAEQQSLGPEVSAAVDELRAVLCKNGAIPSNLRQMLEDRLLQLKRESVRQALKRLCTKVFPSNPEAWALIDKAYALRSELLHEGRPSDLDLLLADERRRVAKYLRGIYAHEYGRTFHVPVAA